MNPIYKLMNRLNLRPVARIALLAFSLLPVVTFAAPPADSTVKSPADGETFKLQHYNLGADKVALSGYDPVGYITLNKALKGRKEISVSHRGVTYNFATEKNKKLFTESPDKYLPAYGGWCATAMAKGEKVEVDPTNFKVTNGRLFLFFKAFYANAIKDWNKDEPGQTAKADANWKKIAHE
jgi:YHS domain-containing protein